MTARKPQPEQPAKFHTSDCERARAAMEAGDER